MTHVKTEAQNEVMCLHLDECQALPATTRALERDMEHIFPQSLQRNLRCQHLDFGLLASGAIGRINSCFLLATEFLVICYGGPRELIQIFRVIDELCI